ncbi:hypothetical protein M0R72_18145 [Candidatus Pacearchaeota archaeon]|jgi:hypothetical protein|nr:hypothetical protein [Candidatus Pacearchaeota archaeon]
MPKPISLKEFDKAAPLSLHLSQLNAQNKGLYGMIRAAVEQRELLLEACKAVLDAINQADLQGTVLWINPPYQAEAIHETASERLQAAIALSEGGEE